MQVKRIGVIALVTAAILAVPFVLQLTIGTGVDGQGFDWRPGDFVVMGTIIFITGVLIDFALQKAGKYRVVAIAGILFAFLWLWAGLAVGVFTNWGS